MSLVLSRIQNLRENSNIDKFEYRASRYGALNAFMVQSNDPAGILTEELKEKAKSSIGNVLETPVIDYDSGISIGNTRTLTIDDSENTSKMISISFTTYSWGFTIAPALYMNNEIGIQKDFETKMKKYIYKFAHVLDEAALTKLGTDKTKVYNNALLYTNNANTIEADWTERENLFGDLEVLMAANDYYGQLHIVADPGTQSIMNKLAQKGLYNSVNKQNEFAGKIVHFSNSIPSAEGFYSKGYAVNEGSLGMLFRYERDCILGTVSGDGHEWGIATLPFLNIPVGTYFYDSVGDYRAIAGDASADMDRTRKEHYGFAVDVAFMTAYSSDRDSIPGPIISYGIKNENAVYADPVVVVNNTTNPVMTQTVTPEAPTP